MKYGIYICLTFLSPATFLFADTAVTTQPAKSKWTPETRKENRSVDLWRYYMRGIVDHFAMPIPFDEILSEKQKKTVPFVDDDISNPYKTNTQPVIQLNKVETLTFDKPLPVDLKKYTGKNIRLFYWI